MTCNKILSGIAMTVIVAFSACNNDDLTIGKSLTSEADKLDVTSAAFPVATRTVTVDSVVARTSDCYFGRIKDPETGAYITTDFMSQFHILESFELVDEDSIVSKEAGMGIFSLPFPSPCPFPSLFPFPLPLAGTDNACLRA